MRYFHELKKAFKILESNDFEDDMNSIYFAFCANKIKLACIQKLVTEGHLLSDTTFELPLWQTDNTYRNYITYKQAMASAMEGIYHAYGWNIEKYYIEYDFSTSEDEFREKLIQEGMELEIADSIILSGLPIHLILQKEDYNGDTIFVLHNDMVTSYKKRSGS